MSRFGHLRSVKKGDRDWVVPVSLDGYTPRRQRGFVPDGRYAAKITDASGFPSSAGNGVNLDLMLRIEAPQEYAGIEIEDWVYLTFDDTGDTKAETHAGYNYNSLQDLLYSVASGIPGKLETLQAPGADGKAQKIGLGPAMLINKSCFVLTERGDENAVMKDGKVKDLSGQSKVAKYIGKEDFEKQPGPVPMGSTAGPAQRTAPELGRGGVASAGGNATAATAKQPKVDDLVNF